ncbi:MAG TPA: hypothetical protein VFH54_04570 [Mycobacteriales bacterium]|nr:hypothetical protein [Mycobacteriales bacterium]
MAVAIRALGVAAVIAGALLAVWSSWRNVVDRPREWSVWKAALSPQHWIEPYGRWYIVGMVLVVAGLIAASRA